MASPHGGPANRLRRTRRNLTAEGAVKAPSRCFGRWAVSAGYIASMCALLGTLPGVYGGFHRRSQDQSFPEIDDSCEDSPKEVVGLEFCPDLEPWEGLLLENKKSLLRLALDAVQDAGGDSPLMLVNHLIGEMTDVYFSGTRIVSGGKSIEGFVEERKREREARKMKEDEPYEPFMDRVDEFYAKKAGNYRPVVVYVTGSDMCAFWDELTAGEEETLDPTPTSMPDLHVNSKFRGTVASAVESGKTPLVLLTLGWDRTGSSFFGEGSECSRKVVELPYVVRWFVSHHAGDAPNPKVDFVGIGFGGTEPRSRLDQETYIEASSAKLRRLEECQADEKLEVLFQCNNNSSNTHREPINEALQGDPRAVLRGDCSDLPRVIPINHFPMEPEDTVVASTHGLYAISPPGTRPDCFRHYEFLLAGNVVYLPDDASLRHVFAGLPVIFVEDGFAGWGHITCDTMIQHAQEVAQRLQGALAPGAEPAFDFSKLTLPYWRRFVRDRVWQDAAALRKASTVTAGVYPDEEPPKDLPFEMTVGTPPPP